MPQEERVSGEARVNVPGSPAEPVGDRFRDRGSLVPVGGFGELAAALRVAPTRTTCRQACGRTGAAAALAAS